MSYEPTQWKDGDLVTSAKLNKIEQGIAAGGGILIAHEIRNGKNPTTLDKTWQEIHDADVCYIIYHDEEQSACKLVFETYIDEDEYKIEVYTFTATSEFFYTDSPNGTLTLAIKENLPEPIA